MRWEDERYVRLYTRDTTDWLALSFDAQALFCLVLRKVDRAGLLPLGRHGKRGVAIALGHVSEWGRLEPALEELLTDGCVRLTEDGATLLVPNFLAAQEARASDKARQQKHRETALALASAQAVTPRDATSRHVTQSHDAEHATTEMNTASHGVTPSRAVPSRAVPSRAVPSRAELPATQGEPAAAGSEAREPKDPAPGGQQPLLVAVPAATGRGRRSKPPASEPASSAVTQLRRVYAERWAAAGRSTPLARPVRKNPKPGEDPVDYAREGLLWRQVLAKAQEAGAADEQAQVQLVLQRLDNAARLTRAVNQGGAWAQVPKVHSLQDFLVCFEECAELPVAERPARDVKYGGINPASQNWHEVPEARFLTDEELRGR